MNSIKLFFMVAFILNGICIHADTPKPENLIELEISNTKNTTLISNLGKFKNLKKLRIFCLEDLEKLPEAIGELGQLEELDLNQGNGCVMNPQLPNSIGNLRHLKSLDLFGAQDNRKEEKKKLGPRRKLPGTLAKLDHLEVLNIGRNGYDQIPEFIRHLSVLKKLVLDFNNLNDIPEWLNNMKSLREVSLGNNWRISCSEKAKARLTRRFPKIKLTFENYYDCPEGK